MNDSPAYRILHLLDHSLPEQDGYSFRTEALLTEQRARGWYTDQVTSAKHESESTSEIVNGFEYFRTVPTAMSRLPVLDQLDVIRTLTRRVAELIPQCRPDLLHAHSPCLAGLAAVRAGRRFGLPVVYEMRSLWEDAAVDLGVTRPGSLRYRLSRRLETDVLRSVDAVTTICAGLKREIVSRGIAADVVTVIPNAVSADAVRIDAALREELVRRYGGPGIRLVGFIGSFFDWEGLDLLVEAAARLSASRPEIRVLLVGGGKAESRIRAMIDAAGLHERVTLTGRVPHHEVGSYYAALDLLVYPRINSVLNDKVTPLKPLEAMAHEALVLASDVGGHRELIDDGQTGLLFAAGDVDLLCAAIVAALDRPDADTIRRAGRDFVARERTWEKSAAGYVPVYAAVTRSGTHT